MRQKAFVRNYKEALWNDPYGEYWIYQTLTERIRTLAVLFAVVCESDIGGSLYNGISDSDIRVYMVYFTGDIHGAVYSIVDFINKARPAKNDVIVLLGDVGANYYQDSRDHMLIPDASSTAG